MHSDIWVKKEVQYDNEVGIPGHVTFVIFRHAAMFLSEIKKFHG